MNNRQSIINCFFQPISSMYFLSTLEVPASQHLVDTFERELLISDIITN
jgi:hypothetical protein